MEEDNSRTYPISHNEFYSSFADDKNRTTIALACCRQTRSIGSQSAAEASLIRAYFRRLRVRINYGSSWRGLDIDNIGLLGSLYGDSCNALDIDGTSA
jgi:hypothetical protein